MKNILIVYNTMSIGGSTTSLLSVLNNLDYSQYKVDLILATNSGELIDLIPSQVNLLEQAWPIDLIKSKKKSIRAITNAVFGKMLSKIYGRSIIKDQIMSYENARLSRHLEKEYDVAVSYLENFPCNYVAKYVKAKKKYTWIHVDYLGAGFLPKIDKRCYGEFNRIVVVSEQCKVTFREAFPEFESNVSIIENILSSDVIREMAKKKIEYKISSKFINLVSVCRITFKHKGLDRGVNAFIKLRNEGLLNKVRWYIIGDGEDIKILQDMIISNNLEENIILLGKKVNPFPYEFQMDGFLLPSRYEGKPMAVTEAQMLGIPPIVTNYASAPEQINHKIDGYIVENNDDAVYYALREIIESPELLDTMRKNLSINNYDNLSEMDKIINLIEG